MTLIRALHRNTPGEGFVELRAIPNDRKGGQPIERDWTQSSVEVEEFATTFGERRSGYGVYMGVCKRDAFGGGKKAHVLSAPALWVDIDTVNAGWDTAATLNQVYTLKGVLQPSAIIRSGGGLHCYWFLDEELRLPTDETRGEIISAFESANATLAFLMGGDSVQNIDRVMRLPGTWNSKRGVSAAKLVEIVYCYPDDRRSLEAVRKAALAQKNVLMGDRWVAPSVAGKAQRTPLNVGADKEDTVERAIRLAIGAGNGQLDKSLDAMWRDRVRYKPGRGYMGLDEAVMITTARLWCKWCGTDRAIERVVETTIGYVDQLHVQWDGSTWSREAQKDAIRAKVLRWAPKWQEIREAAQRAKLKAKKDDQQRPLQ